MNKFIILGSKGMLGQMAKRYFKSQGFNVSTYDHRFNEESFTDYMDKLNENEDSFIINCIGRIKQKSEDPFNLIWSNSILPLALSKSLKSSHVLIQPSTDCVFKGTKINPYHANDKHDAIDLYGWSKSLGETAVLNRNNSLIIRVSIIGLDENSNKGLLSWFLSNPDDSEIKGYINHFWNGITTLEWCKILHSLIESSCFDNYFSNKKILQLGTSQCYNKHQMLMMFQKVFNTRFTIAPFSTPESVNRCLKPEIESVELESQLEELKLFWENTRIQ